MPGGPSMTSTPPRPCPSALTNAPITFNSPARPRIGGVTSRWPPTSNRGVEGPTGCPVYRLLDCHCSAISVGTRPRRSPIFVSGWSIRSVHEVRQLFAGADAQLGERIVDVGFHRMQGKVQLLRDRAVRRALRDQMHDLELGVSEAVPARFYPRLADNATFHTEPAQRAAHPARIGKRLVADVGVEGGTELIYRRVRVVGGCEL